MAIQVYVYNEPKHGEVYYIIHEKSASLGDRHLGVWVEIKSLGYKMDPSYRRARHALQPAQIYLAINKYHPKTERKKCDCCCPKHTSTQYPPTDPCLCHVRVLPRTGNNTHTWQHISLQVAAQLCLHSIFCYLNTNDHNRLRNVSEIAKRVSTDSVVAKTDTPSG